MTVPQCACTCVRAAVRLSRWVPSSGRLSVCFFLVMWTPNRNTQWPSKTLFWWGLRQKLSTELGYQVSILDVTITKLICTVVSLLKFSKLNYGINSNCIVALMLLFTNQYREITLVYVKDTYLSHYYTVQQSQNTIGLNNKEFNYTKKLCFINTLILITHQTFLKWKFCKNIALL